MTVNGFILAEFRGTYKAPHPEGFDKSQVEKPFHIKVKMKRESLNAPGLNGLFQTYYAGFMKKAYPDYIELYRFETVQATNLDGTVIRNPKALSHEGLLTYMKEENIPINPLLYEPSELRNQVCLYMEDKKGQQFLQEKLQNSKGQMLATAAELADIDDILVRADQEPAPKAAPAAEVEESPIEKVDEPTEQKAPAAAAKSDNSVEALLAKKGGGKKPAAAAK